MGLSVGKYIFLLILFHFTGFVWFGLKTKLCHGLGQSDYSVVVRVHGHNNNYDAVVFDADLETEDYGSQIFRNNQLLCKSLFMRFISP